MAGTDAVSVVYDIGGRAFTGQSGEIRRHFLGGEKFHPTNNGQIGDADYGTYGISLATRTLEMHERYISWKNDAPAEQFRKGEKCSIFSRSVSP